MGRRLSSIYSPSYCVTRTAFALNAGNSDEHDSWSDLQSLVSWNPLFGILVVRSGVRVPIRCHAAAERLLYSRCFSVGVRLDKRR